MVPDKPLDERARDVGLSMASLARTAHVPYHKIWGAYPLKADEQYRIESVLDIAERRLDRRPVRVPA